jgi:hypothetical protein
MTEVTGSCLCGAVRYTAQGPLRPVSYCHCSQCRKTSGHFVAATACAPKALRLEAETGLRWYRSSKRAERGFCGHCGSSLFWKPDHGRYISIMAGTLETPTGVGAVQHIFVRDASDYYVIDDGLPHFETYSPETTREE